MKKVVLVCFTVILFSATSTFVSCNNNCIENEVLLETIALGFQVNSENKGIITTAIKNAIDTVRSETNQLYSDPMHRVFGYNYQLKSNPFSLFSTAYAANEDCPQQNNYITRFDPSQTYFAINKVYDGSAVGAGNIDEGANLLSNANIKDSYLNAFEEDDFLNAGAPTPLNISKNFFEPINHQWVEFYFAFSEFTNSFVFRDTLVAYIDIEF